MSKAFTRESEVEEEPVRLVHEALLPDGAPNYLTPEGARRLRAELERLVTVERPAAHAAERSVTAVDARIEELRESLDRAEVVDPTTQDASRVLFGATVTVRDEEEHTRKYRIVGTDEVDVPRGKISWLAPLARALLGRKAGEVVVFRAPRGEEELEIVAIAYA